MALGTQNKPGGIGYTIMLLSSNPFARCAADL